MQHNKIRWGILGCGKIARKFASDLRLVGDAELVAVAARDLSRAEEFAREFPCRAVFGSYDELVRRADIDVVYIASPHSHHHEHTLLCLRHAKAVLCEKPFAINARQTREMVQCARQHGVFLMEALWTRFLPHYLKMRELVDSGALGEVKGVIGNFGFRPQPPVAPRLFDPALGGGALLDIGIYLVFLALSVLGRPAHIRAAMGRAPSGVDEQCSILFEYADGRQATLCASLAANLETDADIFGSGGRIRMTARFYEPSSTLQYYQGGVATRTVVPVEREEGFGYQHEIRHVGECLQRGLQESPLWSLEDTVVLMETLDAIRTAMGLTYPVDAVEGAAVLESGV